MDVGVLKIQVLVATNAARLYIDGLILSFLDQGFLDGGRINRSDYFLPCDISLWFVSCGVNSYWRQWLSFELVFLRVTFELFPFLLFLCYLFFLECSLVEERACEGD